MMKTRHDVLVGRDDLPMEVTLTRPWHWGVALLGDSTADVPARMGENLLSLGEGIAAIGVRHAQDLDVEGDGDWATATVHLRASGQAEGTDRHVLCDVVMPTPDKSISLGDVDGFVHLPVPGTRTRVIVSTDQVDPTGLENVWVDLVPSED